MKEKSLRTTKEWAAEFRVAGLGVKIDNPLIIVRDPDGWDRKNWEDSINEEITESEFRWRMACCTILNHAKPSVSRGEFGFMVHGNIDGIKIV